MCNVVYTALLLPSNYNHASIIIIQWFYHPMVLFADFSGLHDSTHDQL